MVEEERLKYQEMWGINAYRKTSPAFHRHYDDITALIKPNDYVVEFGCGTGVALAEIAKTHKVLGVDIAYNCQSVVVPFLEACIWEPMDIKADFGFCVDVMEHLPTDKVDAAFKEIMTCVPRCLFIACMLDDVLGHKHIGKQLHLTIKPQEWWINKAKQHGKVTLIKSDYRSVYFTIER